MSQLPLAELKWTLGFTDPAHVRRQATTVGETGPTRRVWRGDGPRWELPEHVQDLSGLAVETGGGGASTLYQFLVDSHSDGMIVLHRGAVVYEQYLHGLRRQDLHLTASMAKAFIGLLAGILEDQGLFTRDDQVATYVPELAGTAFGDATIRHLLDMTTQVAYGGRKFHREVEAHRWWAVVAPRMRPDGYGGPTTLLDRLKTARATGPYGEVFHYENGSCEAMGALISRVTGATVSDLMSELIWSKIGADEDARYILDAAGVETACGGYAATLRDIARVGEMLRCGGSLGDRQIVPESVVRAISTVPEGATAQVRLPRAAANSPATMSYRDYWWILNDPFDSFMASGIHGQRLFVSRELDLVVAHFGSQIISPCVPTPPFPAVFTRLGTHLSASAVKDAIATG
ncbi:serine hydrolase domain-containing protein [Rhodococcus wratislaviensis]|uniref:serine hydrolase domain-containing protein n=1 Tax=Rhodococcus wratislaviensis TaxID=44752 RepID=UPI003519BDFB